MHPTRSLSFAALVLAGVACGQTPPAGPPPPLVCNGHTELCDRRYDAVAYPGTHNSYSDTDEHFGAPDQTHDITRQLDDGIRVLHFEVHRYNERGTVKVFACHGVCDLGRQLFVDEMKKVADFMAANPHEVVSLLLERSDDLVTAGDLGEAMKQAGLSPYLHTQAPGEPWPTLGAMVEKGDRLVAFLDDPSGSSEAWLLPRWDWTWETPWDNDVPADFARCDADRGTQGNSLYVVDTYLEDLVIPNVEHGKLVNYDPFLIDRVLTCQQATSTLPNFVLVNFYEVSDLFHVVEVLNGFAAGPQSIEGFPPASFDGGLPDAG